MSRSTNETHTRSPHPTRFSITNFKAFGATQEIPLAPITLIFGENSSGKSSIIQALGLIAQSCQGPQRSLVPWKENGLVDLGSLSSMVHRTPIEGANFNLEEPAGSIRFRMEFPIEESYPSSTESQGDEMNGMSPEELLGKINSVEISDSIDLTFFGVHKANSESIVSATITPSNCNATWEMEYSPEFIKHRSFNVDGGGYESVTFDSSFEYRRSIRDLDVFLTGTQGTQLRHSKISLSKEKGIVEDDFRRAAHNHAMFLQPLIESFASFSSAQVGSDMNHALDHVRKSLAGDARYSGFPWDHWNWANSRLAIRYFCGLAAAWDSAEEAVTMKMGPRRERALRWSKRSRSNNSPPCEYFDLSYSDFNELYEAYARREWGLSWHWDHYDQQDHESWAIDSGWVSDKSGQALVAEFLDDEESKARDRTMPLIRSCARRNGCKQQDVIQAFSLALIFRNSVEDLLGPKGFRISHRNESFQWSTSGPWTASKSFRLIEEWSKGVVGVGPLRAAPERMTRVQGGHVERGMDPQGDSVPEFLYTNKAELSRLNRWMEKLEIPYEIEPEKITGLSGLDVFQIRLLEKRAGSGQGVGVSWSDVGYGISQVIPVIIQSLQPFPIVLIEQPEIHLHPALQAKIADLFIDSIEGVRSTTWPVRSGVVLNNDRQRSVENPAKQFIIETHSEHLILRMLRRVREGVLDPADLSIVYVERDGTESRVIPIRIDSNGKFMDPWPGGFFPERAQELFAKKPDSTDDSGTGDDA